MIDLIWLIPLLPLAGFVVNGLGRNALPRTAVSLVGSGTVLASFLLSCVVFSAASAARNGTLDASFTPPIFDWLSACTLDISLSFLVDPLSAIMLLIVTGIGFLIHVYSIGYMKADPGYGKF